MATAGLASELGAASSESSSRVRSRSEHGGSRAERRVAEYLRALGLSDAARVGALSEEISAHCGADAAPELAVAAAQSRYEDFRRALFGERADAVDPLWLRAFVAAEPALFLGDVEAARTAAHAFGDPWTGRAPTQAAFGDQALQRLRLPSWLLGSLPPLLLTAAASTALCVALAGNGLEVLELLWVALFAFLCALGSVGMTVASLGFWNRNRADALASTDHVSESHEPLPRSVVCIPIYEEDPEHVFAAIAAMRESLAAADGGDAFEIFVLSDSRRPGQAAEEERAFRRVASSGPASVPLYYRRRTHNQRQKAGNLAEFFERFGQRYRYAVVLDADSLMRGETMVQLTRRMHAAPQVALLQAPLELHGGSTLFARAQQIATSVCGPLFMRGLATWSGPHGNYYGHNAVLRVSAFLECCALPALAGKPPLGGDILSHDFVEAALLCRAGWQVRLADELRGSWEECPPTLQDQVVRDRRWCQGNLQHLRVAFSAGLRPMSRIHMLVGAACFLAGPAWLGFVLLAGWFAARAPAGAALPSTVALPLCALTALMLLGPRVMGVVATLRDPAQRAAHGGAARLLLGAACEGLLAAAMAPLLMLHHTRIVLSIVTGESVRWKTQQRRARSMLMQIVRAELPATLLGLGMLLVLTAYAPQLRWWLSPIWLPLLAAMPISRLLASTLLGEALARRRVLAVPSEVQPDELVARVQDLRSLTGSDESARFRDLILDPLLIASHLMQLAREAAGSASPSADAATQADAMLRLRERALRTGPAALSATDRKLLAADATSMRWLHEQAWRHWPVESWKLAREQPQLPPE